MGVGGGNPVVSNPGPAYQTAYSAGIPTSVTLYSQSYDNSVKKEIVYKELDRIAVPVTDTNPLSPDYLRITYLPNEFNLGKNLIRIRPNIPNFIEGTQLYVEIIDYNGDPVYYETELNSETADTFVIISVYIYEDTPPGPCAVYILGSIKGVPIPDRNQIYPVNFRWGTIINIDTTEKTKSPIIFTTLPKVSIVYNTASYDILVYPGNSPFTSSTYYNVQLTNGLLNPSITPLNSTDTFKSGMFTGDLYVKYEDIQLISPARFDTPYLLGSGITSSIKSYITNKSLLLDEPIVIYQQNKSEQVILERAIFTTASIQYEQTASGIIPSSFKKRILRVKFNDLDPFVGQIRNIKTLYRDTALTYTEYLLLSDFIVPSTNVYEGFNPDAAEFSLLLPDSDITQKLDIRFEFYNNEIVPSKQILEIKDLTVLATPPVITNNIGIVMVDPENSTIDAKNLVRTLYQDYDVHTISTSSYKLETGIEVPNDCKCCEPILLAQFSAFIPDGSPYVTAYYNTAMVNLTQKVLPDEIGIYSYNTILQVYEMSTSSFNNFSFDIDEIQQPKIINSTASIQLSSDYPSGHTAYGYPIKHSIRLPETNKLYRFALWHNITVPLSGSTTGIVFGDFNTPDSWSLALLPGIATVTAGTASVQLNAGTSGYLTQTLQTPLIAGQSYRVSVDVTTYNAPGTGDYISIGLDNAPVSDPSISSISSSAQITNVGTYQYVLTPNIPNSSSIYIYFATSPGSGNALLNEYDIQSTYLGGISTAATVASDTLLTSNPYITFDEVSATDPRIDLLTNNKLEAQISDIYTFQYNFSLTCSVSDFDAINTIIKPKIVRYDLANTFISSASLSTMIIDSFNSVSSSYSNTITYTLNANDYIRLELYYTAAGVNNDIGISINGAGTFNLVDNTPMGGAASYELRNISLELLSSTSASFETSCSIKDIDIVSSGFLFISGSRPTYVSGAYDYYVPVV